MARKTECRECSGTGQVRPFETYRGETKTDCPWCGGTGKVDVLYDVHTHGWNGDWTFTELQSVETTLLKAKKVAERVMSKERFDNVLEDGTPTVQWVEIFGPDIVESIALEEHDGKLQWIEP